MLKEQFQIHFSLIICNTEPFQESLTWFKAARAHT